MKEAVEGPGVPRAKGAYSPGLRAGDFVFVAGQGPLDPATGKVVGEDIEAQTRQTLRNVQAILEAAGACLDDAVKVTVHLQDIGEFQRFNQVYATFFKDPRPTRTTVQSGLAGIRIEIDAIAYAPR